MPGSSPVPPGLGCFAGISIPPCLLKVQHSTSSNIDFEDMLYLRGGEKKGKKYYVLFNNSNYYYFFYQNILHRYGYLLQEALRSCYVFCQAGTLGLGMYSPIPKIKAVIWHGQHVLLLSLLHLLFPPNFCLILQVHIKIIYGL